MQAQSTTSSFSFMEQSTRTPTVFGTPVVLEVPDACTYRDLRIILWARCSATFSQDLPEIPPDYFTLSVCRAAFLATNMREMCN